MIEAHKLQPWDDMSHIKADLGSVRVSEHGSGIAYLHPPQGDHPLPPVHEPLFWKAKRDPKAKILCLQSLLRNGMSLTYVGRKYNPKDLKDLVSRASTGCEPPTSRDSFHGGNL